MKDTILVEDASMKIHLLTNILVMNVCMGLITGGTFGNWQKVRFYMKIVIDIEEERYKDIQRIAEVQLDLVRFQTAEQIIASGTPLPKGHGRLIDYGYVVDAIDDWVNAKEYRYTNATDYLRKRVANTPTIIEADKAGEEE